MSSDRAKPVFNETEQPLKRFFRRPVDDVMWGMQHLMTGAHPARVMIPMLFIMLVTWFVYVPIHELAHVYACIWTGGEVSELHLQAHYGGSVLRDWFGLEFVVVGGAYAGQVTGFDIKGNDWIYLATDFGPFLLTVLFGIPMLRLCSLKRRSLLFGPAIIVGLAPFYNLPGDYYEMGSTVTTRALTWVGGGTGESNAPRFEGLRSDDVFDLVAKVFTQPAELGLDGSALTTVFALLVVLISIVVAILLAILTYQVGSAVARITVHPARVFRFSLPPDQTSSAAKLTN